MTTCAPLVNVLDVDSNLAHGLNPPRVASARERALAKVVVVPKGLFSPAEMFPEDHGGFGMLVLDGLLLRAVAVGARPSLDVLGPGDVFRFSTRERDPYATVSAEVGWWGLRPARLAVLDADFTRAMSAYPEVIGGLASRLWRRSAASSRRLSIVQQPSLSVRLHGMLWQLADRFGRRETEGMFLPLPLCQSLLSWLVCARRESVSRALKELERADLVASLADATWWVGRRPPECVAELAPSENTPAVRTGHAAPGS